MDTKTTPAKHQTNKPDEVVRPTKKQQELLTFIESFILENGYSPSYREIMTGLNYTSVATVSLHVNNLIRRGHLKKRDRSARSLEVVKPELTSSSPKITTKQLKTSEEKWLVEKTELFFKDVEAMPRVVESHLDQLYVLIGALKVLGAHGAANAYISRLSELKKRIGANEYVA